MQIFQVQQRIRPPHVNCSNCTLLFSGLKRSTSMNHDAKLTKLCQSSSDVQWLVAGFGFYHTGEGLSTKVNWALSIPDVVRQPENKSLKKQI
ncbi:hypothetical protein TMatcc_009406 [Talaromyces marneffei ATCC 18224]